MLILLDLTFSLVPGPLLLLASVAFNPFFSPDKSRITLIPKPDEYITKKKKTADKYLSGTEMQNPQQQIECPRPYVVTYTYKL
jgi:hypothetical protein